MGSYSYDITQRMSVSSFRVDVPILYLITKRVIDILGAIMGLILSAPIMLLTVIAIKLDSPGPILFSQIRLGERGRPFRLYKFRSMVVGAEESRSELAGLGENGPAFKMKNDPRITRVGRFIRKFSIDELPQLIHVLLGQMSLVGPRPPVPEEVVQYEPWQLERLSVKPGLTCIWQVSGRSNIPFETWMKMDIEYVRNRSLLLDLWLLLLTIPAVITARGAY